MTIIGDKEYHDKKVGQLDENSYLNREKHFSGYIFYHDLIGNFVNGWKYANGKIVGTCSQTGENNAPLVLKSAACTVVTATLYTQSCTDWYLQGQYTYTRCQNPVSEVLFSYVYCLTTPSAGADGGTSGGYNPPTAPQKKITPIMRVNKLNPTQTELLEKALNDLIDEGCLTLSVYNSLVNQGFKINFQIKSDIPGLAAYEPTNTTLYFKDESQINSANLKEELFHAEQDAYYSGGTAQYKTTGRANIEFEVKLYKDVVNLGCCSMFPNDLVPASISDSYLSLVINIQNQGHTSFTSQSYNYWVNLFRQYNPNTPYTAPTSGNFSDTDLLNKLLTDCKN